MNPISYSTFVPIVQAARYTQARGYWMLGTSTSPSLRTVQGTESPFSTSSLQMGNVTVRNAAPYAFSMGGSGASSGGTWSFEVYCPPGGGGASGILTNAVVKSGGSDGITTFSLSSSGNSGVLGPWDASQWFRTLR